MSALMEFQKNLEGAIKEVSTIEAVKKSLSEEVSALMTKRNSLVKKMQEEQMQIEAKKNDLKESKKSHDKYVEDQNSLLSIKITELKAEQEKLAMSQKSLEKDQEKLKADQHAFMELLEKNQTVISKSDQLKKVLELLK